MDNIKDIVLKVMGGMASSKGTDQIDLVRLWPTFIEKNAQKHTKIVGVKDGTVLVNVDSSAWLYQLNINRTKILKNLKTNFATIKNVRFKIGKIS